MTRAITRPLILVLLFTGLTLGCFQSGIKTEAAPSAPATVTERQIQDELGTFARLAADLKPSVVNIQVVKRMSRTSVDPFFDRFFPGPVPGPRPESSGQGSGVIVSPDGDIITNNHVVEGASEIRVKLNDGREFKATVVGTDPSTDVALLHIDATDLPAARLGDSDALQVGDWVMAIGNPFGLEATVTVGVLSGKGRVIGAGPYDDFLQTDASINPGNSGGPLFNTSGEVIGINTAIVNGGQGIGFAIPINLASYVVEQLKETGHVVRGFIGVGIQELTPALRQGLGLPEDLEGALVASIVPGGPADRAGAQVQDVIVALDGQPIRSDRELLDRVARTPVGATASVTVYRDGREQKLQVKIAARPDEGMATSVPDAAPALGISVRDLSPRLADRLQTENLDGVVVTEVAPGSPAQRAGLQPGDIVRQVGRNDISNAREFSQAVEAQQGAVAMLVERDGRTLFVVVGG